jgi:hypothetical protein
MGGEGVAADGGFAVRYCSTRDEGRSHSNHPGNLTGTFASWYNGTLEKPRIRLRYRHAGVGGDHLHWKTFTFRDGILISRGAYPGRFVVFRIIIPLVVLIPVFVAITVVIRKKKRRSCVTA